jgi:hypothetical protein
MEFGKKKKLKKKIKTLFRSDRRRQYWHEGIQCFLKTGIFLSLDRSQSIATLIEPATDFVTGATRHKTPETN